MLLFYRILTLTLFPIFILAIYLRRFINKEHKARYTEKFTVSKKFLNNKKVIWIHAASIGEVNSVIPVIKNILINDDNIFILLTSTTLSSSQIIEKNDFKSENFEHRFFTIDINFLVKRFLAQWKPELVIFVDSEVWPNYIIEISKKNIPLILLNGRITTKTFNRWKILPNFSKKIFSSYNLCLASSIESKKNLISLGATNVKFNGNIKFCADIKKLKVHSFLTDKLQNQFVWCAASTHPGEEEIILNVHKILKNRGVKLNTVIIPRHISRSDKINQLCKNLKLKSYIIDNENEISKNYEIFVINSVGVLNSYFHQCKSIFMGKSLSKDLIKDGGQNPIEPAKCGCKIYHGPYVSNFKEIYELLNKKNIAFKINDDIELAESLFKDSIKKQSLDEVSIEDLNKYGNEVLFSTINEILKFKDDNQ